MEAHGFIAENTTFSYAAADEREALYLMSVLNALVIDALVKPMQSRGAWGPRDVRKRVFDLPIPAFDASCPTHIALADLGQACRMRAAQIVAAHSFNAPERIGTMRHRVRTALCSELNAIDALVRDILPCDPDQLRARDAITERP